MKLFELICTIQHQFCYLRCACFTLKFHGCASESSFWGIYCRGIYWWKHLRLSALGFYIHRRLSSVEIMHIISYFVPSNKLAWCRFYFRFHFNMCILLSTFKLKSFIVSIILQLLDFSRRFFVESEPGVICQIRRNPSDCTLPFVDCKKVSGLGHWKAINKQVSVDFYILFW
jgi:hypothetical protein